MEAVVFSPAATKRQDRVWVCAVILTYVISAFLPLSVLNGVHVTLCPFRAATGLPCPGCGMTHAFVCLGHGNLPLAWHYNALSIPLFVFGLVWLAGRITGRSLLPAVSRRAEAWVLGGVLTIALAYDLYRMLVPAARPF